MFYADGWEGNKMAKRIAVFVTSLTILVFTAGCPRVKQEPIELAKPEPKKVEPARAEPAKVEPLKVEPPEVKPKAVEPNILEPNEALPDIVEPNMVEPIPKVFFHEKCAGILSNFVDDRGMVDYKILKRKRLELQNLLDEFDKLDPDEYNPWPKEDKIAFWLNAYNIQLLNIIVQNYPIKSSRINRIFFGPYSIRNIKGIWSQYKVIVMDEEFTLVEIERRFFRKEFDDPRIFFAISHASLSSPPLRNEPYCGQKLHEQLDDQVKRFLSSPQEFRIDREKQTVYLSAIFQSTWYGKEFTSKYGTDKKFKDQKPETRAVLNFITNYIPKHDVSFLELKNYSVKYIKYDWTINDGS